MDNRMSPEFASMLVKEANRLGLAKLTDKSISRPFVVQTLTLSATDLGTAKIASDPKKIGFPFKSVFVRSATDATTTINLRIGSRDAIQGGIPLYQNDVLTFPDEIAEAYLDWSAQAGKTMQLVFLVDGEFSIGSLLSTVAGGVSIVDGSSFTRTRTTLVAATATSIVGADSSRKQATIENLTGATLYYGESTITASGATQGMSVLPGGTLQWRNTAQLYLYSAAGGDVLTMVES